MRIEEECLKILALHQPVAVDLRFIVAILKINNDLERIADLAVNIAQRGMFVASETHRCELFHIPEMAEKVKDMLANSLDALVNADTKLAHAVCDADDEVDDLLRETYTKVHRHIEDDLESMKCASLHLDISRQLERIADLATNIAEDVIYMIKGQIIRHGLSISRRTRNSEEGNVPEA